MDQKLLVFSFFKNFTKIFEVSMNKDKSSLQFRNFVISPSAFALLMMFPKWDNLSFNSEWLQKYCMLKIGCFSSFEK